MEFNRFLECVSEDFQLVSYLKAGIIEGLPEILQRLFQFGYIPCCQSAYLVFFLSQILLKGRKYYGNITKNALLCYNSVTRHHLVTVVLLKDPLRLIILRKSSGEWTESERFSTLTASQYTIPH